MDICSAVRLFDWQVIMDLDDTYTVKTRLMDTDNWLVAELSSGKFILDEIGKKQINLKKEIKNPKKWTSEMPALYTLQIQLLTSVIDRQLLLDDIRLDRHAD